MVLGLKKDILLYKQQYIAAKGRLRCIAALIALYHLYSYTVGFVFNCDVGCPRPYSASCGVGCPRPYFASCDVGLP